MQRFNEFVQEDSFRVVIYRLVTDTTGQAAGQARGTIQKVLVLVSGESGRAELMHALGLVNREIFVKNYLEPAINEGYLERIYPDKPTHPNQKYRLTEKGLGLKDQLMKKK